jgi:hypothetical protein
VIVARDLTATELRSSRGRSDKPHRPLDVSVRSPISPGGITRFAIVWKTGAREIQSLWRYID